VPTRASPSSSTDRADLSICSPIDYIENLGKGRRTALKITTLGLDSPVARAKLFSWVSGYYAVNLALLR
jgi:hypothetical protein